VYARECQAILDVADKGNADLYQRAVDTLKECLAQFPFRNRKH
jgi:hypothetical protein